MVEIVLEPNVRRRRGRQPLSGKKKAAALFRVWHGVRELIEQAERLGDSELVHFLAVTQLLVEERATTLTSGVTARARGVSVKRVTMVSGVPPRALPSPSASNTQTSARPTPGVETAP